MPDTNQPRRADPPRRKPKTRVESNAAPAASPAPNGQPGPTEAARIDVLLAPNGARATLDLHGPGGTHTTIGLTLDQLTALIHALGQARTAMVANHPVPPMDGAAINPVFVTQWAVQPEALTEGSVIAFQHPAYGPVGFVLPPADAERVVRALGTHLGMVHTREAPPRKPS